MNDLSALPLESLGIEQLSSPHGVLLRYDGRVVAMVLIVNSGIIVIPPSGQNEDFDFRSDEGKLAALDFIKHLRDKAEDLEAHRKTEILSAK